MPKDKSLEVSGLSSPDLVRKLAKKPSSLFDLAPRKFEWIVAELLASRGWEVRLRRSVTDGEYDILAVSKDPAGLETSWLVDCKRHHPDNKVGLGPVRHISEAVSHLGFSNALIVTTSNLTKQGKDFLTERENVQVLTFDDLVAFLKQYKPPGRGRSHLQGKRFYSCFLCHSSQDERFVRRLRDRLQESSIRVWHYAADAIAGRAIKDEVEKAIGAFDKLLLVLSRHSMSSNWVAHEIRYGRERERKEGCRLFFPVALVPFDRIRDWQLFDAETGEDIAAKIREIVIPDFSDWEDETAFERQFEKLLRGLEYAEAA